MRTIGFAVGLLLGWLGASMVQGQAPIGTAFTYQGQLKKAGTPLTNTADFQFSLWDALSGGMQIGTTQTASGVSVQNGLFAVWLDFGSGAFSGDGRWLEIWVRSPAGSGSYTQLTPRQELTPPRARPTRRRTGACAATSARSRGSILLVRRMRSRLRSRLTGGGSYASSQLPN